MGIITEEGTRVNLVAGDGYDDKVNPSYWIETKDGERIGEMYFGEAGYQEAKDQFDSLEN